ncbi:hypothetical protein GGI35DRAFT_96331 [Trichoderma velutinum]
MRQGIPSNPTASLLLCKDYPYTPGRPCDRCTRGSVADGLELSITANQDQPFPKPNPCVADVALKLRRQRGMLLKDGTLKCHQAVWRLESRPQAGREIEFKRRFVLSKERHCETIVTRDNEIRRTQSRRPGSPRDLAHGRAVCVACPRHSHTCHSYSLLLDMPKQKKVGCSV